MIIRNRVIAATIGGALGIAAYIVPQFEGRIYEAYYDVGQVPTICDGDTNNVRMGDVADDQECDERLKRQLGVADRAIDRYVTRELRPYQRAALISFIYNVGVEAFRKSTLLRKLNAGHPGWCHEMDRWNKVNGEVWSGLTKRRALERKLCLGQFNLGQYWHDWRKR